MVMKQESRELFDKPTASKAEVPLLLRWCRLRRIVLLILLMLLFWNYTTHFRPAPETYNINNDNQKVAADPASAVQQNSTTVIRTPASATSDIKMPPAKEQSSDLVTSTTTHEKETFLACEVSESKPVRLTNYTLDALRPNDVSAFMQIDATPILWNDADYSTSISSNNQTTSRPFATCRHQSYRFSNHFPHFMQQFYRCWSFWQSYPHHQPVLLTPKKKPGAKPNNQWFRNAFQKEYTRGLWKVLPDLGIQIVPWENQTDYQAKSNNTEQPPSLQYRSISAKPQGPLFGTNDNAFQVANVQHMKNLRDQVLEALDLAANATTAAATTTKSSSCSEVPKIGFINRRKTRKVRNDMAIVQDLQETVLHNATSIQLVDFDKKSFREQVQLMSTWDILLTPHGAQETSILFLNDCGGVLELMPKDYFYPKFFGILAATCGIHHAVIHMNTNATATPDGQEIYSVGGRDVDTFCPARQAMRDGLELLIQQWKMCCDNMQPTK